MRWGMAIDLQKCVGCYACQIACKQEHFLPPDIFWARVMIAQTGTYPQVKKQILPVLCNHCKEAPCVKVCPTGASSQREDGIVWIDYDKCIGCRYCVIACPYQHRTYLKESTLNKEYFPGYGLTPLEIIGRELYPLQKSTVIKCNFCMERLERGLEKNLQPGIDREATPACVNACPAKARYFGNLEDPISEISWLMQNKNTFPLHPEFETEPSVYYLDY